MNVDARERILHFVRHGQYVASPEHLAGMLTGLGKTQARRVAKKLREVPVAALHVSDLTRAIETAEIISGALGGLRLRKTKILRETRPTAIRGRHVPLAARAVARENLDAIVERFFRRSNTARHEVIVCHGNMIRALVCRVLGVRLGAWLRMRVHNCGITRVTVRQNGRAQLLSFNDVGHLPQRMLTVM